MNNFFFWLCLKSSPSYPFPNLTNKQKHNLANGGQHELHSVLSNHRLATSSMGNHGLANDTTNLEQPDLIKTIDVKNKLWMDFDDFLICFK